MRDGTLIKAARQFFGLSQEDFAHQLCYKRETIARWERAEQLPPYAKRYVHLWCEWYQAQRDYKRHFPESSRHLEAPATDWLDAVAARYEEKERAEQPITQS